MTPGVPANLASDQKQLGLDKRRRGSSSIVSTRLDNAKTQTCDARSGSGQRIVTLDEDNPLKNLMCTINRKRAEGLQVVLERVKLEKNQAIEREENNKRAAEETISKLRDQMRTLQSQLDEDKSNAARLECENAEFKSRALDTSVRLSSLDMTTTQLNEEHVKALALEIQVCTLRILLCNADKDYKSIEEQLRDANKQNNTLQLECKSFRSGLTGIDQIIACFNEEKECRKENAQAEFSIPQEHRITIEMEPVPDKAQTSEVEKKLALTIDTLKQLRNQHLDEQTSAKQMVTDLQRHNSVLRARLSLLYEAIGKLHDNTVPKERLAGWLDANIATVEASIEAEAS
jgi:hypothetical protein